MLHDPGGRHHDHGGSGGHCRPAPTERAEGRGESAHPVGDRDRQARRTPQHPPSDRQRTDGARRQDHQREHQGQRPQPIALGYRQPQDRRRAPQAEERENHPVQPAVPCQPQKQVHGRGPPCGHQRLERVDGGPWVEPKEPAEQIDAAVADQREQGVNVAPVVIRLPARQVVEQTGGVALEPEIEGMPVGDGGADDIGPVEVTAAPTAARATASATSPNSRRARLTGCLRFGARRPGSGRPGGNPAGYCRRRRPRSSAPRRARR